MDEQEPMTKRRWTVQKEERMVELWADQPCLFDINCPIYHDRVEKEKKWTEIAEALQMPVAEVKTRSNSLRTQFSRLLRPQQSGREEKPLTSKQKWILRTMDFLKPFVTPRNTETSLVIEDSEMDTQGTVADEAVSSLVEASTLDKDIAESVLRPCTPGSSRSSSPSPSEPSIHQPLNKKARHISENDIELQKLELLKEMSKTVRCGFSTERDGKIEDESGFGRQVAVEVSHIKDVTLKTRAKKKVMTILYEFQEADQQLTGRAQCRPHSHDHLNFWPQQTPSQYMTQGVQHNQVQPQNWPKTLPPPPPPPHQHIYSVPQGQPGSTHHPEDGEDN